MNQSQPKISLITIAFNSEKTIEETFQSVFEQNYPNLEYILIDGGSTDGTLSIVERYREHFAVVVSEPDRGISDAFNKGIAHATGELVGIINSDDVLLPNALHTLAQHYEEGIDVYRGNIVIWNEENGKEWLEKPTLYFSRIPIFPHIAHQSTFITREAYNRWGVFREEYKYIMDFDLLLRLDRAKARVKHVDEALAKFRLGGVTARSFSRKKAEYLALLRRNGGTWWESQLFYYSFLFLDYLKRALDYIGPDVKRQLRYLRRQ